MWLHCLFQKLFSPFPVWASDFIVYFSFLQSKNRSIVFLSCFYPVYFTQHHLFIFTHFHCVLHLLQIRNQSRSPRSSNFSPNSVIPFFINLSIMGFTKFLNQFILLAPLRPGFSLVSVFDHVHPAPPVGLDLYPLLPLPATPTLFPKTTPFNLTASQY